MDFPGSMGYLTIFGRSAEQRDGNQVSLFVYAFIYVLTHCRPPIPQILQRNGKEAIVDIMHCCECEVKANSEWVVCLASTEAEEAVLVDANRPSIKVTL